MAAGDPEAVPLSEAARAARAARGGEPRRGLGMLARVVRLDLAETLRSRWFAVYVALFGAIVALLFVFGLTESRVLGFMGLSRLLVTYIQLCLAILPIFVLVTTVRSMAGDREAGVLEYLLALPVGLGAWFWGKFLGRLLVISAPVLLAMSGAAGWATFREIPVPWDLFALYAALLVALALCFLGIAMGLSAVARSVDVAQGAALAIWLVLVLFLDLVLLGVLIQERVSPELVVGIAVANPLQAFRSAALLLFDPQLVLLGPSAFVLLDAFGRSGFLVYALVYPPLLGLACAGAGFLRLRRGDLL